MVPLRPAPLKVAPSTGLRDPNPMPVTPYIEMRHSVSDPVFGPTHDLGVASKSERRALSLRYVPNDDAATTVTARSAVAAMTPEPVARTVRL